MKRFIPLLLALSLATSFTNSYAYTATDKSSLDLPLSKEWQISKSEEEGDYAKITVYTKNPKANNQEELFQSTLKKTFSDASAAAEVKKLQTTSAKLMNDNKCSHELMKNLPKGKTYAHEWGMFWQCPRIKTSGFLLFLIGDKDTMYNFTYRAGDAYPLTKEKREEMIALLKSIKICYKNNRCEDLL